ncbi:Blp family class II bacteriocin [Vagococcus fluvialis]|uniref:Blp family class II bacteriocin n=1 Tax=Vagococcus fluvialis TaxID=2738 RepID=UPI0037A858C0
MKQITELNVQEMKQINGGWVGKTKNIPNSCKDSLLGGAVAGATSMNPIGFIGGVAAGFIAGGCHRV